MKYFDTHCHLNGDFYKSNIDEDIKKALENNVTKILIPGTDPKDSFLAIEMAKKSPNHIYAAVGIHPSEANSKDVSYLEKVNPEDIIAVGEIGIDLYHEDNPSLENQEYVFRKHIDWALLNNKPVLIHMREATEEVYKIVSDYPNLKFVMHSYTGDAQTALRFIELGGYISFSGIVTFKNALKVQDAAKQIPLERILVETDAPFLSPSPHRGEENKPDYVRFTAHKIAELKGKDQELIVNQIYLNSLEFFNIKGDE